MPADPIKFSANQIQTPRETFYKTSYSIPEVINFVNRAAKIAFVG